ncbi:hypothetical protein M0804_011096 [Polistes exclamans]|nr:hypothetical protein M0804_011096 [Polistes exclamans]
MRGGFAVGTTELRYSVAVLFLHIKPTTRNANNTDNDNNDEDADDDNDDNDNGDDDDDDDYGDRDYEDDDVASIVVRVKQN